MVKYTNFKYIYPCRPVNPISPDELDSCDDNSMISQLKLNGSNALIFTNGESLAIMGRHKQILSNFRITESEIIENLYKPLNLNGNWIVLNAEYLNKSKKDENGEIFNHKLVIFDILVYDSNYLIGKTFKERVDILDRVYGKSSSDKDYLYSVSDNIYRVKSYDSGFKNIFDNYTEIDLIEGLVIKRKNSRLEAASGEKNNWRGQLKCRKPTKLYKY
jgi:hypothetical protein